MDIKFVGTGGPFDVGLGNSAAIVSLGQQKLLLDCGHAVFPRLLEQNIAHEIDGVFISHFHDDHIGSLSSLVIYHTYIMGLDPLPIYVPTAEFGQKVMDFLEFSLGKSTERVQIVVDGLEGRVYYIDTFGQHVSKMQTWAFIFIDNGQKIAYSGDLGQPEHFFNEIRRIAGPGTTVFHDVCFNASMPAHAHYKQLESYASEFDIYGYHCDPAQRPADLRLKLVADHPHLLL